MHIALYGATGLAGSRILTELLARGHRVTAIVRDPAKLPPGPASPSSREMSRPQPPSRKKSRAPTPW